MPNVKRIIVENDDGSSYDADLGDLLEYWFEYGRYKIKIHMTIEVDRFAIMDEGKMWAEGGYLKGVRFITGDE